jgi:hypothetical protein
MSTHVVAPALFVGGLVATALIFALGAYGAGWAGTALAVAAGAFSAALVTVWQLIIFDWLQMSQWKFVYAEPAPKEEEPNGRIVPGNGGPWVIARQPQTLEYAGESITLAGGELDILAEMLPGGRLVRRKAFTGERYQLLTRILIGRGIIGDSFTRSWTTEGAHWLRTGYLPPPHHTSGENDPSPPDDADDDRDDGRLRALR